MADSADDDVLAAADAAAGDVLVNPPAEGSQADGGQADGGQAAASPVPETPPEVEEHSAEYLCKVLGQCPQGSLGRLAKEETADYQCKTFGKQVRLGLGLG